MSVVPYRVKWAIALGDRFELDPDDLSGSDADEHGDQLERPFGGIEEHFVSDDDEYYDDVEDDVFDENVDPNVNETREQRHTRRMRQAKEETRHFENLRRSVVGSSSLMNYLTMLQ